jgi:hypothetical protein
MSGKIVGEIGAAAPELHARGIKGRTYLALLAIAERCNHYTRTGAVPRIWVETFLGGVSKNTAVTAVEKLVDAGLVEVVKRGSGNRYGGAAPIYKVLDVPTIVGASRRFAPVDNGGEESLEIPTMTGTSRNPRDTNFDSRSTNFDSRSTNYQTADQQKPSLNGNNGNNGGGAGYSQPQTPTPQKTFGEKPPSRYCSPGHEALGDDAPPCRKCKRCREDAEAHGAREAEAERQQAAAAAAAKQAAIHACPRCDDDGRIETTDAAGNDAVINCTHHNDREYA